MSEKKNLPAQDIRDLFFDPKVTSAIEKVIPHHLTPQKLLQVAVTVIRRNYMLMQCTKQSLLSSVMGAAILGLELEPVLGQAYLVPYKNKKGYLECQLIPGYRGYIALSKRSGSIHSVTANEVYSNDVFEYELGLTPKLKHIPAEGNRGEFRGAYVVFEHKDGSPTFEYMPKERIDMVMNLSKSKDQEGKVVGPWKDHYNEMAKKTVIRHRAKYEPICIEFARARELEERALIGESQFDLLPAPKGETDSDQPEIEGRIFDDLVKEKVEAGKDISRLNDFISVIAETNNSTVEEVKLEASKDWQDFWGAYEKWLNTGDAGKEENNTKGRRGRAPGSKNKPKDVTPRKVKCPNTGEEIDISACETCPNREGCPAW